MICGIVIDYSGSIHPVVRDVARRILEDGCLHECEYAVGTLVSDTHVLAEGKSMDVMQRLLHIMAKSNRGGESRIIEKFAAVHEKISSLIERHGLEGSECLFLILTDAQQDIQAIMPEPPKAVCNVIKVVVILLPGESDAFHSQSEFAERLRKLLDGYIGIEYRVMFEYQLIDALKTGPENSESREIVARRASVKIVPLRSLRLDEMDYICELLVE